MQSFLFVAIFGAWLSTACAQFTPPEATMARSFSGQFLVRGLNTPTRTAPAPATTNQHLIRLESTLVAVSCERIKQLIYHELGVGNAWRGKIFLSLYPAQTTDQAVTIVSEKFRDGWQYQVQLPDLLERVRYVRTIVQVVLLEFANRTAKERSAEIPVWLGEAFTQQLLASNEMEIILPPPRPGTNGPSLIFANLSARRDTPKEQARKKLQSRPPLSFDELSWPAEEHWSGDPGEVYRSSAQLFLNELIRLKDGRSRLRAMLAELPQRYNWQFAFLSAFDAYFLRTVDVEKWWALQMVHFISRDASAQTWPFEESWQKLDQVLHSAVEIHTGTTDLPLPTTVTLQKVIREWDHSRQLQALQAKIRELDMLQPRIAREFAELVDNYRQVLLIYLQQQDKSERKELSRAAQETLKRLDELDSLRAALRRGQKPVAARKP
jgi:hypothetical protein